MKHRHEADINVNLNLPKEDLEDLIDKTTTSIVTIIATVTVAHILKGIFVPKNLP